ncbi:MAG TPA: DUF4446 family protein [Solirubrobacteraceae bacterium]|jgi:hypothetical protein|nr:DUF4446 family protein [Solirubrobacteraceae bacterium]
MAASITDTQGIIAIAAGAVAIAALIACAALSVSVRRLRRAQRLVLGERQEQDVVAHAAALQQGFAELSAYVYDVATRLDARLADVESALRGRLAHRALVRYDAYNELSGQQSMSIALLDDQRSGIVLSCIHHRDQARVYGKQVHGGRGELELSPEEAEAVRMALAGDVDGDAPTGDEQPA